MLDPANGLAPGDPARMAAASVDTAPAPLRMILGSQALDNTVKVLQEPSGSRRPRPTSRPAHERRRALMPAGVLAPT